MSRVAESFAYFLPVVFLLTIGLFFGIHSLYEWSHADVVANDPILKSKSAYLNSPSFIFRCVLFFVIWMFFGWAIQRFSGKSLHKATIFSVLFLVAFAYTYSLFSVDLIMSLEPHWFSTIFGVYTFSGLFVNALAVLTLLLILVQKHGYLTREINENHYHDLGKLLFGFSTFWAYIWFSQYLLIWYSNIPEETMYYYLREHYTWDWLFYANLIINWLVPFFALMTRESKRKQFVLIRVCIVLLVGRWLDIYLMVAPPIYKHAHVTNPYIGWNEIIIALGFGALFILVVERALKRRSLLDNDDPYLKEGIHLEQ